MTLSQKSSTLHQCDVHAGFAAISAVFLLVVLAALGAYMLTLSNTQHITSAQDLQGSRAYWAARAGLEWGAASAVNQCPSSPASFALNGLNVQVTCSMSTYQDGAQSTRVLSFESQASNGAAVGTPGYVERSLSATLVLN